MTKKLQDEGKLQMLGIIQEQHPHRARLFMQWKGMSWPVLVDSLNLLDNSVVPLTFLVDEHGVIRFARPGPKELNEFLSTDYPAPEAGASADATSDGSEPGAAERIVLWERASRLGEAIAALRKAIETNPDDGRAHFRLGVAYRMRYDSPYRVDGDFANAVEHWGRALDLDPNQYIWRRRIQQYGPRLKKPYPFYDWVVTARKEIEARKETAHPLPVEPGGAELASPVSSFETTDVERQDPDPEGRVLRDEENLILVETLTVPAVVEPGEPVRAHVVFRPNDDVKGHWNNEVEDLVLWLNPPPGWSVERRYLSFPVPPEPVSQEIRQLEVELASPENFAGTARIPAYALYYVCEDVNGTCLYRRRDLTIEMRARERR